LTLFLTQATAQSYKQQFNDLFSKEDTLEQRQLLEKWEKSDANDPELFVSYFNYYATVSKKEVITLGNDPKDKEALQLMDQDTSKKEPAGYLYSNTHYEPDLLKKGFEWIEKGIAKHPNRLDMRFGHIYMLGQLEDYEKFTKEIIKTVDYSAVNKNKWTWSEGKPVEDDPKEFMLSSIQGYQGQLYDTENDDLLDNMKRIAEAVLKHYPDHVESLSNLSIVYLLNKQYDKALEPLLKAEKINAKDAIVLNNIAHAYKLKGDNKNSIKYYERVIQHGDDRAKKYAQKQIDELNKK
jgi:tetratricopeptide (TPR) repeat protein